jgi:hypothetical protein
LFARKRLVRLHLEGSNPSLEGLLVGWPNRNAGHYVLKMAQMIERVDAAVTLDGVAVRVPRERVVFVQELRS